TGPRQPALNPSGLGNLVTDRVQFTPFGTDPTNFARVTFPPTITFWSLSPSTLTEGQVTTLTGIFTDADATQVHTLQIDWGDGSGNYTVIVSLQDPSGGGFFAMHPVKVAPATAAAFQSRFVERLFLDLLGQPVPSATLATLLGRLDRGMSREKLTLMLQHT